MSYDVTSRFFHWMEANNISRQQAAELLGIEERSLSTYRSRGLPKRKYARANQIMLEHATASIPTDLGDQKISVTFTDEDFDIVERAATIVGSTTRSFIHKAALFKAKEELQKSSDLRVAEDPTDYKINPEPLDDTGTEGNG